MKIPAFVVAHRVRPISIRTALDGHDSYIAGYVYVEYLINGSTCEVEWTDRGPLPELGTTAYLEVSPVAS